MYIQLLEYMYNVHTNVLRMYTQNITFYGILICYNNLQFDDDVTVIRTYLHIYFNLEIFI